MRKVFDGENAAAEEKISVTYVGIDLNDTITIDGVDVVYPINQEVVTIRGIVSGEYIINLQYYKSTTRKPVEVTVKVEKVNPSLKVIYVDKVTLQQEDDEKTVVRITLDAKGEVKALSHVPKLFTNDGMELLQ